MDELPQVVLSEWRILRDRVIPRNHRSDDWLKSIGNYSFHSNIFEQDL